jgi:hypothetical protein
MLGTSGNWDNEKYFLQSAHIITTQNLPHQSKTGNEQINFSSLVWSRSHKTNTRIVGQNWDYFLPV